MLEQIKIYVTAKREHAEKIKAAIPDGFHCNARWIYMLGSGERPVTHWLMENFDDAIAAHFVILYVEAGDNLRTSLVEVGHALAHGKKIFIAGERDFEELRGFPHKNLIPWANYTRQIKLTGSLEQTFKFIRSLNPRRNINNDGSESKSW